MPSRRRLALFSGLAASSAIAALLFTRRRTPSIEPWPFETPAERHAARLAGVARGEPGSGGHYGTWSAGSPDAAVAEHIEFQYAGMEHQSETALSGMWLFLATELLFFGGLFLLYMIYRSQFPHAFAVASQNAEVLIGTVNTLLLLTSSAVFAWGLGHVRRGDNRRLFWACVIVAVLGLAFLGLKGWEWKDDLDKHLFPGPGFAITGPDNGGAQLFWIFYWIGTALHGVHMIVGVALVAWLAWTARQGRYSTGYFTPPEVVGLYWSFVDMVWLCLYPMIYLVGGVGS
jgi:cytochrome c oxidase subunit 3